MWISAVLHLIAAAAALLLLAYVSDEDRPMYTQFQHNRPIPGQVVDIGTMGPTFIRDPSINHAVRYPMTVPSCAFLTAEARACGWPLRVRGAARGPPDKFL